MLFRTFAPNFCPTFVLPNFCPTMYIIKLPYYIDCGSPMRKSGETIDSAWKRCSGDYQCSLKCVQAYIKRYQGKCPANMNACEKMSRVHNGGPGGCRSSSTNGYWAAIKKCHG
uniref:lysozyme n=1 Tax=Meloidogyne incognita TaxID=6306 RepID=A0A914NAC4_MELIC